MFGKTLSRDPARLVEIQHLETHVVGGKGHHRLFGFPVLLAVEQHGLDVLNREARREIRMPERPIRHENAFTVGHASAHIAPRPFIRQQQVVEISRRADLRGFPRRQLAVCRERKSASQREKEEMFHSGMVGRGRTHAKLSALPPREHDQAEGNVRKPLRQMENLP